MPLYRATIASQGRIRPVTFAAFDPHEAAHWAYGTLTQIMQSHRPDAQVLTVREIPSLSSTRQRRLEL